MKNANKFHNLIWKLKAGVSVAKPEPPGAAHFMAAPGETVLEPIFFGRSELRPEVTFKASPLHLSGKQKGKALFLY